VARRPDRIGVHPQIGSVLPAMGYGEEQRIAKRRGRNIAKVALARRMLTLCYYGLRDGEIRCLQAPGPASARPVRAAR